MRIGIITANDNELAPFLEEIQVEKTTEKSMLKVYEGKLADHDVVLLYAGACKVNAGIATQMVIDNYHVDKIINCGVAGGMDPTMKILDTAVATEVAYHDVADFILTGFHPWMKDEFFRCDPVMLETARKALDGFKTEGKIVFGRIVTGEAFIEDDGREEINAKYHPLTVDMETGAMAHACYVNQIPFLAVRCVTDTAEHSGDDNYQKNVGKASRIAMEITMQILRELA